MAGELNLGSIAGTPPAPRADARTAWLAAARRQRWRRRLLPLIGGGLLLAIWWALIAVSTCGRSLRLRRVSWWRR